MLLPPYETWDTPELYFEIVRLLDRAIEAEDRQPDLDEKLAAIYAALADPIFADGFAAAVVERAVAAHMGLVYIAAERGAVLDALLAEYEKRFRAAVGAPGGTF